MPSVARLFVAEIFVIVLRQETGILPITQILLKASVTFRVHITLATKQRKQNREEDEGVGSGPKDQCDPDSEVINFENLCGKLDIRCTYGENTICMTYLTPRPSKHSHT